jgi:4-hydroxy-tetrahydrodipicolinate synthase
MQRLEPLRGGLWAVLATPFTSDASEVDIESFLTQVDYYLDQGVAGLVALGVNGEALRLSAAERYRLLRELRSHCATDVPIVVGIPALPTEPSLDEIRNIIDALGDVPRAIMAPLPSSRGSDCIRHFDALHERSGVPFVAQDYPKTSGVNITVGALKEIVEGCMSIVALKAEAPPTSLAVRELSIDATVPIFGGLGATGTVDELAAGAVGAITGFAYPGGLVRTIQAFHEDRIRDGFLEWTRWHPYASFVAQDSIGLAMRKETLRRLGVLRTSAVRMPGAGFPDSLSDVLDLHMAMVEEWR